MLAKTSPHTQTPRTSRGLVAIIAAVANTALQRIAERAELNQLMGMSDDQLKDIGVTRSDIIRQALRPIWRAGD